VTLKSRGQGEGDEAVCQIDLLNAKHENQPAVKSSSSHWGRHSEFQWIRTLVNHIGRRRRTAASFGLPRPS